ncbi:MAG TPA: hypothetical protein DCM50_14030, partial [Stenotrophomonas sp.]|nr:hypothetical protein [Stenotrophomonas sp.]
MLCLCIVSCHVPSPGCWDRCGCWQRRRSRRARTSSRRAAISIRPFPPRSSSSVTRSAAAT